MKDIQHHSENKANSQNIPQLVKQWHEAVEKRDREAVINLLHKDLELKTPFQTEAISGVLNVMQTMIFFIESMDTFQYRECLTDEGIAALKFDGTINGETLEGVDFFHFDAQGKVFRIEVMARPLSSIEKLGQSIKKRHAEFLKSQ